MSGRQNGPPDKSISPCLQAIAARIRSQFSVPVTARARVIDPSSMCR